MKSRIIEICELGQPQSIIQRENESITELIKTDSLIEELNEQLLLYNVVGRSQQLVCDCLTPSIIGTPTNDICIGCGKPFKAN